MNGFIMFGIMFITAIWAGEFATVIWRLHCFTVSFRGDVHGESGPKDLASIGELRNGHVANLQEL